MQETILNRGYVNHQGGRPTNVTCDTADDEFTDIEEPTFVTRIKEESKISLVGGKAFNLSKMARKGIPVPRGFCITTEVYDYFIDFNNISGEESSDKIREGLMPACLREIITNAYEKYLNGRACAVRSSSPFEDLKSASFAGQYKSFLNVKGETLPDAVKECWASAWSRPAAEYRKKMGIDGKVAMAVLVQEMVPAEASGVLFTEDNMVVEAVWGLGDILVGGTSAADRFVVEREGFTVLKRTISHKQLMSQVTSEGGVKERVVPDHLQDQPALNDDHLQKLCTLGKKVDELFGCPQDIEWALHNNNIVILQARPITVKQTPTIWSRANIAETQPGYVTYLSRIPENRPDFFVVGVLPLLERFGIKKLPDDTKFLEYIYGHIYANITNLHKIIGSIPGLPPSVIDQSIGFASEEEGSNPSLETLTILKMSFRICKVIHFFMNLPKMASRVIPHSLNLTKDIRHRNLEELTLAELDELVWKMYDANQEVSAKTCNADVGREFFFLNVLDQVKGFAYEQIIHKRKEMAALFEFEEHSAMTKDHRICLDIDLCTTEKALSFFTIKKFRESFKFLGLALTYQGDVVTFESEFFEEKGLNSVSILGIENSLLPPNVLDLESSQKRTIFKKVIPYLLDEIRMRSMRYRDLTIKRLKEIEEVDTSSLERAIIHVIDHEFPGAGLERKVTMV